MVRTAAIGDGPIVFFSGGLQIEVPLSAIYFDNDVVGTLRTDLPMPAFQNWIAYLASRGRLVPGVAPPPPKSIVVTAAEPGSAGNDIQLEVKAKSAPGVVPVTVDVTVTETDRYTGLTLATLATELGVAGGADGKRLGLVVVTPNASADLGATVATNPNVALTAGTWTVAGAGASAVKVQPRRPGAPFDSGETKTLAIAATAPADGTFALTATWKRTATDVAVTNIVSKLADLGYLVTVASPDDPLPITKLPRTGTFKLAGGNETVAATKAAAIVMADD
jgi:hypothetical protein